MDKKRYLRELAYHLRSIPSKEREEILETYQDHFKIGEIDGKHEEEIILDLGPPQAIAETERVMRRGMKPAPTIEESTWEEPPQKRRKETNVGMLIIVLVFNLIFVVGPVIGFYGFLLGGWSVALVSLLSPVIWSISFVFGVPNHILSELSLVLIAFGIGIFIAMAMYYLSIFSFKVLKKYTNWLGQLIGG